MPTDSEEPQEGDTSRAQAYLAERGVLGVLRDGGWVIPEDERTVFTNDVNEATKPPE